jgi:hypothetical protein
MKNCFLTIGIILMAGCTLEQKPDYLLDQPQDLVPKEKMVSIIMEAHLYESLTLNLGLKYDSARTLFKSYYEPQILEKHQVSESTYVKSYQYYLSDPQLIQDIYETVIDSLAIRQSLKKID